MKILVADRLSQAGLDIFSAAEGVVLNYQPKLSEKELLEAVVDADALVVRSGTRLTAAKTDNNRGFTNKDKL